MATKKSNLNKKLIGTGAVKHIPDSTEIAFLCFLSAVQDFQKRDFTFMKQMFGLLEQGPRFYELLPVEQREEVKKYITDHGMAMPALLKGMDEILEN